MLNRVSPLLFYIGGEKIPLDFSAGWVDYEGGETAEHLLKRADEALYAEKESRKNQVQKPGFR